MSQESTDPISYLYDFFINIYDFIIDYSLPQIILFTTPPFMTILLIYLKYQQIQRENSIKRIEITKIKTKYEESSLKNKMAQVFYFDKKNKKSYAAFLEDFVLKDILKLISLFKKEGLIYKNNQKKINSTNSNKNSSEDTVFKENLNKFFHPEIKSLMSSILQFISNPQNKFKKSSQWKFDANTRKFQEAVMKKSFLKYSFDSIQILNDKSAEFFNKIKENDSNCIFMQIINAEKEFIGFCALKFYYEWGTDFIGNKKLTGIRLREYTEEGIENVDRAVLKSYIETCEDMFCE